MNGALVEDRLPAKINALIKVIRYSAEMLLRNAINEE